MSVLLLAAPLLVAACYLTHLHRLRQCPSVKIGASELSRADPRTNFWHHFLRDQHGVVTASLLYIRKGTSGDAIAEWIIRHHFIRRVKADRVLIGLAEG